MMIIPAGGLLVVSLPLVFAVQESLHLCRRHLLTLRRQCGRLTAFTPSVCARRRDRTRLLRAPLRHSVHLSVHPILPTHHHQLPNTHTAAGGTLNQSFHRSDSHSNQLKVNKVNMNSIPNSFFFCIVFLSCFLKSTYIYFRRKMTCVF